MSNVQVMGAKCKHFNFTLLPFNSKAPQKPTGGLSGIVKAWVGLGWLIYFVLAQAWIERLWALPKGIQKWFHGFNVAGGQEMLRYTKQASVQ